MSLDQQLFDDMKEALRGREKIRLNTLRMLRSQIKNREIETGGELSDNDILQLLSKAEKMRKEAIVLYRQGNREDLAAQEEAELAVIRSYLPERMGEEQLRALIGQVIADTGAQAMADLGKVMGALMPKVQGLADGQIVNRLVRENLQTR
ncbi:MAG: GatB/YqeY domain-containing protein [Candidatus Latescibacterota bacterium]